MEDGAGGDAPLVLEAGNKMRAHVVELNKPDPGEHDMKGVRVCKGRRRGLN